jgi:chemotaxis protein CheD
MNRTEISIGNLRASNDREILSTTGVGSCLAITLYDATLRMGAMAHAMLPGASTPEEEGQLSAKYVENAIDKMLWELEAMGAKRTHIEAKLAGAANMFPNLEGTISQRNIASAKRKLAQEGIPLVGESLGGSVGRSVEFATNTGILTVKIMF